MVPAVVVEVPALPLTGNGKLDRAHLPAPSTVDLNQGAARVTARTATERALTAVWSEVLGIDEPDIHDNFFALGGDSIVAIRVSVAAQAAGLPVTIERIFLHPTIADLAAEWTRVHTGPALPAGPALSTSLSDLDPADLPVDVVDAYPTAAMQLAILFECELTEVPGLYHDLITAHLDARFDRPALDRALATVCARHEILRTSFNLGRFREPMQFVHRDARMPVTVDEAGCSDGAAAAESALRQWWRREQTDPFDLGRPPLVRCRVLPGPAESFQLSLSVHHSVLDGWSLARLMTELVQEYDAQLGGSTALAPLPPTRYRDFVAAEQAAAADPAAKEFWNSVTGSSVATPLPVLSGDDAAGDEFAFRVVLMPELDGALRRVAADLGLPLKSVFFAAHTWALRQLTGRPDVVSGVQVNGRLEHEGSDLLLGLFLNIVPVGVTVDGGTWAELVAAAFNAERTCQPFRRYPLASMQQVAGRERTLFEAAFNYTDFHTLDELDRLQRVRTCDWCFSDRHSFPLLVEVVRSPGGGERAVAISAGVASPLAGTGARLGELILKALRNIAANPHAPYGTSDVVTAGRDAR